MSGVGELRGRAGVFDLFEKCVERPKPRRQHRELPIVVLLGQPGSGKSAVLDDLDGRWGQVVPLARLDLGLESEANRPPREIVLQLAFQLARRCPQFGRMPFRHLMLCLVIAGAKIDPRNRQQALDEVRRAVIADAVSPHHKEAIAKHVGDLEIAHLLPPWSHAVAGILVRGLETVLWRRRLKLALGIWPGRGDASAAVDPRDLLVDLSVADADKVDEVFCEAFLADLRAAYRRGLRAAGRTANCAALLDNVGSSSGERFLDLLGRCRAHSPDGDPLVVVATSGRWVASWGRSWTTPGTTDDAQGKQRVRSLDQISMADWAACRDGLGRDSWGYLVMLPNLTVDEVTDLALTGNRALGKPAAEFVHRLTAGHPLGVRRVLDVLGRPAEAAPAMRTVLDDEDTTGPEPVSLARAVRERMLRGIGAGQWATLASFAVAEDPQLVAKPAGGTGRGGRAARDAPGAADLIRALRGAFLIVSTSNGRLVLDPWLRRLVMHELATMGDDHPDGWWAMHSRHRSHHQANRNIGRSLHHGLALGEIPPAVDHLATQFDVMRCDDDAERWVDELYSITSAPNRLTADRAGTPPGDRAEALVTASTHDNPVLARLVVATWLLSDPLADPQASLRSSVRRSFERLAEVTPAGYLVFIREADRFA
jgi:hypothetical protein